MAIRILRSYQVPNRDDVGQARAVHSFVQSNILYVNEPGDIWYDPLRVLWMGGGDCDDHAIVTAALLEALAFKTKITVLRRNGRGFHVYCLVGLPRRNPSRWVPVETTLGVPFGWDPRKAKSSALRMVV
jgi:transglutaminase-like putative cysteine protease